MLPHPVTFVCDLPIGFPDISQLSEDELLDPDFLNDYPGAVVSWVLRTYLVLRSKGLPVSLSPKLIPGRICIVCPYRLGIRDYSVNCFTVGCRSDFARPMMCDMTIVQNKATIKSSLDILMPHWPQPGLIPRLDVRGSRVETMAFKG